MAVQGWCGTSGCQKILWDTPTVLSIHVSPVPETLVPHFPWCLLTFFHSKLPFSPPAQKRWQKHGGGFWWHVMLIPTPFKDQSLRNIHFLSESTPAGPAWDPRPLSLSPQPQSSVTSMSRNTDHDGLTVGLSRLTYDFSTKETVPDLMESFFSGSSEGESFRHWIGNCKHCARRAGRAQRLLSFCITLRRRNSPLQQT